jgi:hypothetical protein
VTHRRISGGPQRDEKQYLPLAHDNFACAGKTLLCCKIVQNAVQNQGIFSLGVDKRRQLSKLHI